MNNQQIHSCANLRAAIRTRSAGDQVWLLVERKGETFRVLVVLAER